VDILDHRIDAHRTDSSGEHHRGVVAGAANDAAAAAGTGWMTAVPFGRARAGELGCDRFDQGALGDALAQRCR
jgi:hypothetical protein